MIDSIEITNFQSHKNTKIDLSPGLNVIIGNSNNGKSSIVRALKWVILNRPRGSGFKSHFAKKKDIVSAKINFNEKASVTRGIDNDIESKNFYKVEKDGKEEIYKALGTDVPQEVQDVIQMNSPNIQSQGDGYFMLGDSPGTRAKVLNKIVGLNVIDEVTKKINSIIKEKKNRVVVMDEEIDSTKKKLKAFKGLIKKEKEILKLERLYNNFAVLNEKLQTLNSLVEEISQNENEKEDIDNWLVIEKNFALISYKLDSHTKTKAQIEELSKLVNGIELRTKEISDITLFLKVESGLKKIEKVTASIIKMKELNRNLKEVISDIRADEIYRWKQEEVLSYCLKKLNEIDVCPTCGQEVKGWDL